MAGTLVISTLSDGTNSTSSTNPILGSAKAWVQFNGVGGASINASYNVSSVTYNGSGDYTVNFTSAMTDANYSAAGMAGYGRGVGTDTMRVVCINPGTNPTASALRINTCYANGGKDDVSYACVSVFR